jgi:hypothetical protein
MSKTQSSPMFAGVQLPIKPALAADGASIYLIEEPVSTAPLPFFGGYAEDFLADLGFDVVEEAPIPAKAKQV